MAGLTDPVTAGQAHIPISPCPTVKHRHDFDGQKNAHLESWNVSASGVLPTFMANKVLDAFDEYREVRQRPSLPSSMFVPCVSLPFLACLLRFLCGPHRGLPLP